ncbi:MAG: hypothetical protein WCG76_05800 [Verrucomicrobiota bacterium]
MKESSQALGAGLPAVLLGGLLPETSGRTLDEIQSVWRDRAATLFSHHHKPTTP